MGWRNTLESLVQPKTSAGKSPLGIPYQSLINLYLKDCAASGKKLDLARK
jgi:hypothetical protein